MKTFRIRWMGFVFLFLLFRLSVIAGDCSWQLPVRTADRTSWETVKLTVIGRYGIKRKARPGIPSHLHTGTDIARPSTNYVDEPIYPAGCGVVVSMRNDGPFGQIIVEHVDGDHKVWTAYEHIVGISVTVGDTVSPDRPMARFMTRAELNRFGWQFDHVHFEVFKIPPKPFPPSQRLPQYRFSTYNLSCYSKAGLDRYYTDPEVFLKDKWR